MPFPTDVSHPFRYPSELRRLVEAVRGAGGYDETRWIEWKRTLDLTATAGIRHIVKQILGFANRDPQIAAMWAGGYAYLVIGASPEALEGVTQADPEQLVSKVRPYVGSAVTWTPEYIEVDGTAVLVIIVEPPRPGDEIHVLRKALDPYRPGTVFIRRHGQVNQADPDELGMLQRRLLARASHIQLAVEPATSQIEAHTDLRGLLDNWISQGRASIEAELSAVKERPGKLSSLFERRLDYRTPGQYKTQMDSYFINAKIAWLTRGVWQLARYEPARLGLQVVNRGDRNYTEVVVNVTIAAGAAEGYDTEGRHFVVEDEPPTIPMRPDPWGTREPSSLALQGTPRVKEATRVVWSPSVEEEESESSLPWSGGWRTITAAHGIHIEFDPCNLRPHETAKLPAVPLLVNSAAVGETIGVEWAVTATNADGRITGTCAISVVESTLGLGWISPYLRKAK